MNRVPFMDRDQMLPENRDAYDQILGSRGQVLNIFQVMLNSPEAAKRLAHLGEYLRFHGSLSNGLKEATILATAREMRNHYVWTHHEILAREAEVTNEIIDDIRQGTVPKNGTPQQALVVQYTWQLLKHHMVTDDVFEQIHQCLGNEGVVDITLLIGFYATMSLMISALKVNLESGVTSTLTS